MAKEYLLDLKQKIWVNDIPIPPGTFDRLRTDYKEGRLTSFNLRTLDMKTYNLPVTSVEFEHVPEPANISPNKALRAEDFKSSPTDWPIQVQAGDSSLERIFKGDKEGSDPLFTTSSLVLESYGIEAINIQNAGHQSSFPMSEVTAITANPIKDTVTIASRGPDQEIFYNTYARKMINSSGKTKPLSGAIAKAESILQEKTA